MIYVIYPQKFQENDYVYVNTQSTNVKADGVKC